MAMSVHRLTSPKGPDRVPGAGGTRFAYSPTAPATTTVANLRAAFGDLGADRVTDHEVSLVGRAVLVRDHGGIAFVVLQQDGDRIQVVVADERVSLARSGLERSDVVAVTGVVGTTRAGELSVFADEITVLAPNLLPPPDKFRGPRDPGRRARERELDLIANETSARTFRTRSAVVHALRAELHDLGFTEVETPMLSSSAGGAVARPFSTHHHALDIDLHLRIAPELHLKRLVVGGFDRVFEIGRVFRNEGIDSTHNPEFTILEAYQSPGDQYAMMDLVERLVGVAAAAASATTVELDGTTVDLTRPWRRVRMLDVVEEVTGRRIEPAGDLDDARAALDDLGVHWQPTWGPGRCLSAVFDQLVEATLVLPTIVFDHPLEVSPLARRHRSDPGVAERFEVFVGGRELANAYSELNDPVDQRARMESAALAASADEGVRLAEVDEDFLRALARGMAPTGGLGIGIDRLVMLLTGATSIRDVVLFPTQRPERHGPVDGTGTAPILAGTPLPTTVRPGAPVAVVRLSGLVRVMATLTTVVGVLTMLSALPALAVRVGPIDELLSPVPEVVDSRVLAVGLGLCMVLLAGQLLRGKRRAWKLAVGLFTLSAALSVVRGGELVALVASVSMIGVLALTRRDFTGLKDPPSVTAVALAVPRYLVFVYTYGFLALWSQRNVLDPPFGWVRSAEAITAGLVGLPGPYTYSGRFAAWFPTSLVVLGVIGLLLLLWLLLRPAVAASRGTDEARAAAEAMVDEWGWDTLAPFALRRDRSWFFSSDGRAMIAYGYLGGFALGSGDPIGDPASVPLVVDEFIEHCRHHGWQPAFLAAREIDVPFYAERGFRDFYLGDEAVLDCRRFDLDAPGMGSVRRSVRRVEPNHRFELMSEAAAGADLVAQLNDISVQWRRGEDERGYTMAMSTDVGATDPERLLAVAWHRGDGRHRDDGGARGGERPVAFLRLIPVGRPDGPFGRGYTLDLMRRLPDAANGIVEALVAQTVMELDDRGVRRLSLNFAAFSRLLADDVQHNGVDRLLRRVVDVLNPYYQIRSLRDFNEKFQPEWQPRSLIYADPGDLPKVGLRYAFLEGFVDVPLLGRMLSGPAGATDGAEP